MSCYYQPRLLLLFYHYFHHFPLGNHRILKHQIPQSIWGTESGKNLCLDFVSVAARETPWKVQPASLWPSSTYSPPVTLELVPYGAC